MGLHLLCDQLQRLRKWRKKGGFCIKYVSWKRIPEHTWDEWPWQAIAFLEGILALNVIIMQNNNISIMD